MSPPRAEAGSDSAGALTAVLTGAFVISFSAILYRLSATEPATAAFFRMVYAIPVLAAMWAQQRSRDTRTATQKAFAFGAGIFLGADVVVWQTAIDQIGAGLATLIVNSQVVLVPLVTWLLFREKPSRRAVASTPLVLAGLAAITGLGQADSFGARPVFGVIVGIAAAVFYTGFLVTFRWSGRALSPASGPLLDATIGAAVTIGLYGVLTGELNLAFSWPAHGWLLVLAIGSQVVGWMAIGYSLPRLSASVTSFAVLLQPTLTLVWGWLIFGEQAGVVQLLGVGFVLGGIAVVATAPP